MNPSSTLVPPPVALSRVLIIANDSSFCAVMRDYLGDFGYQVSAAPMSPAGVERASAERWHAIILDATLPGLDGGHVLRQIRHSSKTPVLMLTARGDRTDLRIGPEIGADDYLPKGASALQLLGRLHAITRRGGPQRASVAPAPEIVIADLRINPGARTAARGGRPIPLTPGEFDLLVCLAHSQGRVKTRDHLLAELRAREYEVFDRAIDVQISALRRKLGDNPKAPRFIRTVRSVGYLLVDPDAPPR